jgi:hypothetical protein
LALCIPLPFLLVLSFFWTQFTSGDDRLAVYLGLLVVVFLFLSIIVYVLGVAPALIVLLAGKVWPRLRKAWAVVPLYAAGCAGMGAMFGFGNAGPFAIGAGSVGAAYALVYCLIVGVPWR